MPIARVNGLDIAYDLIGDRGRPWTITPGGRFSMDDPGVRELGEALAEHGNRVVIWDRPNCGRSSVCFEGPSESAMQADALAGLLRQLDLGPAVIAGGSGGARVSMLTASRHPDVASGMALWWISGGIYGLLSVGLHYCGANIAAAWQGSMLPVLELPEWQEVLERNPANREVFLAQHPMQFRETMERWLAVYCPGPDDIVPGLTAAEAATLDIPALVFRSGDDDMHHTRATSERIAAALPNARLVEPPWGVTEWRERQEERTAGITPGLFVRWPLLAPQLLEWAEENVPG